MKCSKCGNEIANDSLFCEFCGAKISLEVASNGQKNRGKFLWIILALFFALCILGIVLYNKNSSDAEIETLSYTEHTEDQTVKTYFAFTSKTDVIWLFATPWGNVFPVGWGNYDPDNGDAVFLSSDPKHKNIAIYKGTDSIVFNIDRKNKVAKFRTNNDRYLSQSYNDGKAYELHEEEHKFVPNNALVGSMWAFKNEKDEIAGYVNFITINEAEFVEIDGKRGEVKGYVCFENMVAIKTGDNLRYENLIGNIQNGNKMLLCRDGIAPKHHHTECFTLHKIENEHRAAYEVDREKQNKREKLIYKMSEERTCDGKYYDTWEIENKESKSLLYANLPELQFKHFRLSFDFMMLPSDNRSKKNIITLDSSYRIFGLEELHGNIIITTDNKRHEYDTGIAVPFGDMMHIDLEYNNGTVIINGLTFNVVVNNADKGNRILSTINFSCGCALYGKIRDVKVYNIFE